MKKTILVVEDHFNISLTGKLLLESFDYVVLEANTGESAIEIVQNHPEIDLILMDIDLGSGIDGTEAAKEILKHHDLPLIFHSSHLESEIVNKTEGISSYGYVVKGSGDHVLNAAINMAFKLHESHQRFKNSFHASPIPYALNDNDLNIIDVNQAFIDTFGYDLNDIPSVHNWWPLAYPDEAYRNCVSTEWEKRLEASSNLGIPFEPMELTINCKNGQEKIVMVTAVLLEKSGLNQVIFYDVTERKRLENESKTVKDRLLLACEASEIGIWEYDLLTNKLIWDDHMFSLYGITKNTFTGTYDAWEAGLHPADKQQAEFELSEAAKGGKDFNTEFRVVWPDGSVHFIRAFAKVKKNDAGQPIKLIGANYDISDRKLTEERTQALLTEKEIILKEAHHRMKNNFSSIEALLVFQISTSKNTAVIEALKDAVSRVKSMRVIYDKLLLTDDASELSAKDYIESLCHVVTALFPKNIKIELELEIDDFNISTNKLFNIGIIINELLTNTLKYAFINRDKGIIKICVTHEARHVKLSIQDNGQGLPASFNMDNSNGFGITIVKMLSKQLAANVVVENNGGTKFIIDFNI